ncbi:major facilitator superfamily domain-containing protein [Favolaschia claudopus]|uniref:Major facilitator superfamily domain-containing protein n=1 Tax=Favolaschia claudopus TaxID=2862362 RepID=A0AAW0E7S1_9AGAR
MRRRLDPHASLAALCWPSSRFTFPPFLPSTTMSTQDTSAKGKDLDKASQDSVQVHVETIDDAVDPIYQAKARILNEALQDIGMGRYQWGLFMVTGFGWLADNLWPIVTGLILVPVLNEFAGSQGPFLKLGQNIGLLVGAAFWGVGADVWGRKLSFNLTMLITGVFGISAAGSPNYIALCSLAAVWSVGVGGNLPVDSSIFLEFVPASHQYLLTVLSIWWAFGQLLGSLVAWPLIGNYSCTPPSCPRASNQGWRYFLYAMGGLMIFFWGIRFFVFKLYESPKYLMGTGKDEEAVAVVHKVAAYNGKTSELSIEDLRAADKVQDGGDGEHQQQVNVNKVSAVVQRKLSVFGGDHVRPLFATRELAYSTSLLIVLWAIIGLAFPLYNSFVTYYLSTRGADFGDGSTYITYRNTVILSVTGVPGALVAGYLVELPLLGRKGTLAISTALTGLFILLSTTSRTSDALLGWNCAYTFTSNVMYGVLYALSPELFPTKDRGTGNALVATANRIFGIMAPIVALYADLTSSVPIFISGALFIVAGLITITEVDVPADYVTLCALMAVLSVGVGGNFPVDSTIFIEFVPASHQYLLTVLSVWWAFGQILGSLVAWPLIGNYSCTPPECSRSSNQGWRYFLYAMGGLMLVFWAIRFFVFDLYESPKYLMGIGKDEEAVAIVHKVAAYNKTTSDLSVEDLKAQDKVEGEQKNVNMISAAVRQNLSVFNGDHVRPLFATRKLAYSTGLLILIWGIVGLAFPLYGAFVTYYLDTRGATFGDGSTYITYRNTVIISVTGVPGSLIAGYLVELPHFGRKGTLFLSTALTGVFILLSTTSRSSNALLAWNCAFTFTSATMYGVLYALSPELFPTKYRGTGNALCATANRIFGVMAPIIALYADLTTSVPIFIAGALFIVAGVIALLLPFESRGLAAL